MSDLKVSIIGYGKMGKEVEKIAKQKGIEIFSIIDPDQNSTYNEISLESISGADVCIDFTTPNVVLENIKKLIEFGKNVVVGTTGWYEHLNKVKILVENSNTGLIYSQNFSIGVNLYYRILQAALRSFKDIERYGIFGYELHHEKKLDSPSGTAKYIENIIKKETKREINFSSIRVGSIPGTHVIGFDSPEDTIEIIHTARNRSGFAIGAILAAEWIRHREGFYDINDFMEDYFKGGKK